MKLSLAMIVRNEEKNLARCLDSIKDYVDEIVITDTGSIDKTKEVGRGYGAKIYDFEWQDDFSMARNYCIEDHRRFCADAGRRFCGKAVFKRCFKTA